MAIPTRRFRHPALRGALLALLAAFTAAGAADALGVHACPHHDRLLPERSHASGDHAAPGATAAPHAAGGAAHHGHDADHDGHGPCTCVGGACSAAAFALPGLPDGDLRPAATVLRGPDRPLPEARRVVREAYLHPFANAPPTA